jgi:hypothetical protein
MMAGASEVPRNPYVGPRPFEEGDHELFYGRDEEIAILAGLVMARRAVLLFAQSGAGKSSLLRAGLIPELTRQEMIGRGRRARVYQKMQVLPVLTVGGTVPEGMRHPIANIYVFRALLTLLPDVDPDDLAGLTLADALSPFLSVPAPANQSPQNQPPPVSGRSLISSKNCSRTILPDAASGRISFSRSVMPWRDTGRSISCFPCVRITSPS